MKDLRSAPLELLIRFSDNWLECQQTFDTVTQDHQKTGYGRVSLFKTNWNGYCRAIIIRSAKFFRPAETLESCYEALATQSKKLTMQQER